MSAGSIERVIGLNMAMNPFVPNAPFFYLLKTSENRKDFWCFQGLEKGERVHWEQMGSAERTWKGRLKLVAISNFWKNCFKIFERLGTKPSAFHNIPITWLRSEPRDF